MPETRAQSNRRIRQEALREQLEAQGHVQHVVEIINDLTQVDEISSLGLQKIRLIIDTKLALIKKYLPDTKQIELTGDPENPIQVQEIKVVYE